MRYLWTEDAGAGLHFWKLVKMKDGLSQLLKRSLTQIEPS